MFPKFLLKRLYKKGSLANTDEGFEFTLKNNLTSATIQEVERFRLNNEEINLDKITFVINNADNETIASSVQDINEGKTIPFTKGSEVIVKVKDTSLEPGTYEIAVDFKIKKFGTIDWKIKDKINE